MPLCQIWLEVLRQCSLQMSQSVATVSDGEQHSLISQTNVFPLTTGISCSITRLDPGPFESTVKASNQAWAKIEIWECDTADPAGNVLSSLSIPVHMHPWPLFAGTTGLKLICACISLRASLPRLQDCFAWLQTFNRSGAAAQPVCDVRAKQMVFFPSSSAWTLDLLVTCWRQNCCLPEPLRNAWRDHVYLLFGGALTPQQGALTELVARVKRNVGQTEPFNGRSG